jgi:hypothetical protein
VTNTDSFYPITDPEKKALQDMAVAWGAVLDFDQVEKHAKRIAGSDETITTGKLFNTDKNKEAACVLIKLRSDEWPNFDSEGEQAEDFVEYLCSSIILGKKLIEQNNVYWRFEPTIEKVLELGPDQSKQATNHLREFETSDYGLAFDQQEYRLLEHKREWIPDEKTSSSVETGIDLFRVAVDIYERGFPLLLGIKRILDNKNPSVSELQSLRARKVRKELTNTAEHKNSAYFDLVVDTYDSNIRNALSHGDLLHNSQQQSIQIPNDNITYTYEEFIQQVSGTVAASIFLTGMLIELVYFSHIINTTDNLSRDVLRF